MLADGTAVCIRTFCCAKAGLTSPANTSAISAANAFLSSMVALHKPRHKASYFCQRHASDPVLSHAAGKAGCISIVERRSAETTQLSLAQPRVNFFYAACLVTNGGPSR